MAASQVSSECPTVERFARRDSPAHTYAALPITFGGRRHDGPATERDERRTRAIYIHLRARFASIRIGTRAGARRQGAARGTVPFGGHQRHRQRHCRPAASATGTVSRCSSSDSDSDNNDNDNKRVA